MRFGQLIEERVPEVEEEEEVSEEENFITVQSIAWCLSVVFAVSLATFCLITHPDAPQNAVLFVAFYLVVEIVAMSLGCLGFLCYMNHMAASKAPASCTDVVSIFSVCSMSFTNISHVIAVPVGSILLVDTEEMPLTYKTFVIFEIIVGIILSVNLCKGLCSPDSERLHELDEDLQRATAEIYEVRSRTSSLQSDNYRSSAGRREFRSSSIPVDSEESESSRERSVSTGTPRLKLKRGLKSPIPHKLELATTPKPT